ncbi:MAG: glycosyltransferase family 39 protein [Phycisphaerales bacterium]|nr:glycosyltransferase family 39 protein [Phycisphaerales bacterium]
MARRSKSMTFDQPDQARSDSRAFGRGDVLAGVLLILLAALVLLPGISSIPVIDRDEARFVQASRQMLDSGTLEGWTVPMVGERYRLNKPPLIYWLQAGVAGVATGFESEDASIWMYRFPSFLAALCTVLLTWRIGSSMFGGRVGLLAGSFMAVSPLVAFDAHMARSDQVLLALTTAAMAVLWTCWRDGRHLDRDQRLPVWRTSVLWLLVGLGMLTKGPITPMVVLLAAGTLAAWTRDWRWFLRLRPFSGLLIALATFLPWVILAGLSVGFERLAAIAWDEIVVRSASGRESHGAPPGYHLVLMVGLLWPGTLLTGIALGRSWRRARVSVPTRGIGHRVRNVFTRAARGRSAEAFCLTWLLPCWLVFELAATKLPHYTLPLYPALALVSARAVLAGSRALPQARTTSAHLGFILWFLLGTGIVLLPALLLGLAWNVGELATPPPGSPRMDGVGWLVIVTLAIGALFGLCVLVIALRRALQGRLVDAQLLAIPAGAVSLALVFGVVLPAAWPIWITPRIVHHLEAGGALDGSTPVAAIGFQEDSLVHATNGRLQPINLDRFDAWCRDNPGGWVVLPEASLPAGNEDLIRGRVSGFNYSNGNWFDLAVVRTGPND